MPVLGHAFVGLATATCTRPKKVDSSGAALWAPILVGLAYLPDIVNQLAITCGLGSQQVITHSLFFAVAASIVIAPALAWLAGCSILKAAPVTLFSILTHVTLDILQGSNRQLWWPFSSRHVVLSERIIPLGLRREAEVFGVAFVVFWVCHFVITRLWAAHRRGAAVALDNAPTPAPGGQPASAARPAEPRPGRPARVRRLRPTFYRGLQWAGRIAMVLILASAAATHYLKYVRQKDMDRAFALVNRQDYDGALAAADRANQWPYTSVPGRVELVKARAYAGMKKRDLAEAYYLASMQADPAAIWPVIELVELYASGSEPLAERRRKAEPYLHLLRTRFSWHQAQPQILQRLEQRFAEPPPRRSPPSRTRRTP